MPGDGDRRDRQEATRLFVAATFALIILVALGAAGIYYFAEVLESADPFSQGLGLKNAALISFVAILVMAVVSGGDAILGELPFTVAGFLISFVIFWLTIAWIF
jgi:hypothetical protein